MTAAPTGRLRATSWAGWRYHPDAAVDGHGPSADKPQTKLARLGGALWAVLARPEGDGPAEHALFELVTSADGRPCWRDTGCVVASGPGIRADLVADGVSLWVAVRSPSGVGLTRWHLDPATRRLRADRAGSWVADGWTSVSVSVAAGRDGSIWLACAGDGRPWCVGGPACRFPDLGPLRPLPGAPAGMWAVDVVALGRCGDGVGALWSDQGSDAFRFARLGAPGPPELEVAAAGGLVADDHVAVRTLDGRLFAAVKTSRDDDPSRAADDAQLLLLVREVDGSWHTHRVAGVEAPVTRPIPLLEPAAGRVHVLYSHATARGGQAIHVQTASLRDLEFPGGPGSVLLAGEGAVLNDVSGGREPLVAGRSSVVVATDAPARRYVFGLVEPAPDGAGEA